MDSIFKGTKGQGAYEVAKPPGNRVAITAQAGYPLLAGICCPYDPSLL